MHLKIFYLFLIISKIPVRCLGSSRRRDGVLQDTIQNILTNNNLFVYPGDVSMGADMAPCTTPAEFAIVILNT